MFHRVILVIVGVLCLRLLADGKPGAAASDPKNLQAIPRPRYEPPAGPSVYYIETQIHGGTVTEMNKDSITVVRGPTEELVLRSPAGVNPPVWETIQLPPQPPRKFAVSEVLRRGDVLKSPFFPYPYRLSDLRVGDVVTIRYRVVNKSETIEYIQIAARPEGKVPYPPGTDERYWKGIRWWGEGKQPDSGIPRPLAPPPRERGKSPSSNL